MSNRYRTLLGVTIIAIAGILLILSLLGTFYLPGVYQIGTEVVVPRTPNSIWKWFVHSNNWNRRFSVVYSVEDSFNKEAGVGEELQIRTNIPGGVNLISNIVVTDWVKERLIGDRHKGDWVNGRPLPLTNVTDRFEFKPEGLNKTRVTFKETFEVHGPINKWLAYLVIKPVADRFLAEILNEYNNSIKLNHTTPVLQG
ncbi:MAG: SRPBCC family protein [Nitrospiria bacterium]